MTDTSLWKRVKDARAARVAIVYGGACWFVLQLVNTIQEMLALPDWVGPVTILLLVVGFVVVMATAWVQSLPATTAAEAAGEIPTDWQIAPGDAMESLRAGRLPHLTWGRAILGGVVAISLTIGAAGGYVLLNGGSGVIGPAPVDAAIERAAVAVLPFNVNGPGLAEFGEGMVSLVSMNIDGVAGIRSVNPRTVMAEWGRAFGDASTPDLPAALRAAGRTGARYAVVGDAVSTGETVRFRGELYDLVDGSLVGEGGAEGALADVLPLIDEMSIGLLRTLIARSGNQSATGVQRLEGLVTRSVGALNAYLEGEALFRRGQTNDALEAYERATAADSTFALAWSRVASVYGWVQPGSSAQTHATDRVMANLDRLPAREVTLQRGYAAVTARTDVLEAMGELQQHVRRFPDDPEGWAVLGEIYSHVPGILRSQAQLQEALLKPVDLDPTFAPYYVHALRYLVGIGDWRFYEYMELYRGAVSEERAIRYQMQWDYFYGADEARAAAEEYYRANEASAFNTFVETFLRADSTAERSLELIAEHPAAPFFSMQLLTNLGRQVETPQDAVGFIVPLEVLARAVPPVLTDVTVHGVTPTQGAALLADLPARLATGGDLAEAANAVGDVASLAEASDHLAAGRPADARLVLEGLENRFEGTGFWPWWSVYYAESLARTGAVSEAIAWYETDLLFWRGVDRLRLGELYESIGDTDRAHANFDGFLRLFREADDGAAQLVARGRAGLARTGG